MPTRAELTSLVVSDLKVRGTDADIHEAVIRKAIDVAIRYFFVADYRESRREMMRLDGKSSRRHNPVSPAFVRRFDLDVLKEDSRSAAGDTRLYVSLSATPMLFGRMHWLREVYPHVEGLNPHDFIGGGFRVLSDRMQLRGIDAQVMQGIVFAYPEIIGDDFRVYLFNALPLIEKAVVYYAPDPSSLSDDEELLLPNGIDMKVVETAVNFFLNPRQMPDDLVLDEKDDATKTMRR